VTPDRDTRGCPWVDFFLFSLSSSRLFFQPLIHILIPFINRTLNITLARDCVKFLLKCTILLLEGSIGGFQFSVRIREFLVDSVLSLQNSHILYVEIYFLGTGITNNAPEKGSEDEDARVA
jgi:hypothetical protein